MNISKYFSSNKGLGILSTANAKGEVNSAVYAKPHELDDGSIAFIMRDRLTHANIRENPNANFLFIEHDNGFTGIRLNLEMVEEITDKDTIASLSRRAKTDENEQRFLVSFKIRRALQLIGGEEIQIK